MDHILLLEDDFRLAMFWQHGLEHAGFRVTHCMTAADAIQTFDSQPVDLVISDILIRDENRKLKPEGGLSLVAHISLTRKKIPVLCVTGADQSLDLDKHLELFNVHKTFQKPIDVTEIVRASIDTLRQFRNECT